MSDLVGDVFLVETLCYQLQVRDHGPNGQSLMAIDETGKGSLLSDPILGEDAKANVLRNDRSAEFLHSREKFRVEPPGGSLQWLERSKCQCPAAATDW